MNDIDSAVAQLERARRWVLHIGALVLIATVIGAIYNPEAFFQSYLFAFIFWLQSALGCLGLLMLNHLVGGAWGAIIQRVLEAGVLTIPMLTIFFVPVLIGLNDLYVWTHEHEITETTLHNKEQWLTVPGFVSRTAVYFVLWSLLAWLFTRWSKLYDRTRDPKYVRRQEALSGPGLVLFVLSVTFSTIDWVMSLEPEWYTTAYGFIMVSAQGLSAMAFSIVVMSLLQRFRPLSEVIQPGHFHDLGNLLLAFLMFWTYCAFSQYLIFWSGNIPEEVVWYVHRSQGGWIYFAYVLIFAHFVLPFLLLLSRRVKQRGAALGALAAGILVLRFIDIYWLILPAFHPEGASFHWLHAAVPLALGVLWLFAFLTILKRRPLLPYGVPAEELRALPPLEAA